MTSDIKGAIIVLQNNKGEMEKLVKMLKGYYWEPRTDITLHQKTNTATRFVTGYSKLLAKSIDLNDINASY